MKIFTCLLENIYVYLFGIYFMSSNEIDIIYADCNYLSQKYNGTGSGTFNGTATTRYACHFTICARFGRPVAWYCFFLLLALISCYIHIYYIIKYVSTHLTFTSRRRKRGLDRRTTKPETYFNAVISTFYCEKQTS